MIEVSNAWKNAHTQMLLPESFLEISMDVIDDSVSGTFGGYYYPQLKYTKIINAGLRTENEPYAWLEHNLWSLDGSKGIAPDLASTATNARAIGSVGYPVWITLSSPGGEIPGVTITWSAQYKEYATDFTVTAYVKDADGNYSVLSEVNVTNNDSMMSVVDIPISEYDRVAVTVNEWSLPDHRCRIDSLKFGQVLVFDKNQIISYSHEMSGCPLGTELSNNTIEFEIDNTADHWNPLNPVGLWKYLTERQTVVVNTGLRINGEVEWIQTGKFYLSEWKSAANGATATFAAGDIIDYMLNTDYSKPYTEGETTAAISAYKSKDDVWPGDNPIATIPSGTQINVYEKSVQYINGYGDDPEDAGWMRCRTEYGWVNFDYVKLTSTTLFEELSKARNTIPSKGSTYYATGYITSASAPISVEKTTVAEFVQNCVASSGSTLWQRADGTLRCYKPYTTLSDYVISTDVSYSYPEIDLTKPLKAVEIVYHYPHHTGTKSEIFEVGDTGDRITVDAPYIWWDYGSHRKDLANKHTAWWSKRTIVSGEFRADPRLELFDVVTVETKFGTLAPVMITQLKYTYNGSFRATYTGKLLDDTATASIDEGEIIEGGVSDG